MRRFEQETKTLLVTDMVVKVEDEVPEIVAQDPSPLLFHARDNAYERVENTSEVLRKGWRRIVQVRVGGLSGNVDVRLVVVVLLLLLSMRLWLILSVSAFPCFSQVGNLLLVPRCMC